MPELPEVETTRRGIEPHLIGRRVVDLVVRERRLRWPVAENLAQCVCGREVRSVARRAKYLLLHCDRGCLLIHLGMSGSLHLVPVDTPAGRHDHLDVRLDSNRILRFTDPRRFGSVQWITADVTQHRLLRNLGPEPLQGAFDGNHLYLHARSRRAAVKSFIMDSRVVVGVGNIYASEALFAAGIHPSRAAGRISQARYGALADAIQCVLEAAIAQGGTTLRDFTASDGRPGYFRQALAVYGRAGEACLRCGAPIRARRIAQRNSFFCTHCQT